MTKRYLVTVECRKAGTISEFYRRDFRVSAESDYDARHAACVAAIDAGLEPRSTSVITEWDDCT